MLKGKNAVITGARGGIGKACVQLFAERGANVWACMRSKDDVFDAFAEGISESFGVFVKPVYFDMSYEDAIKSGIRRIIAEKLPVDILVNNAGIAHGALLHMTSMSELRNVFQVNFFSHVLTTQLITRVMARQKSGAVVNIVSVAGLDGKAGYTAYGSSKAALAFATRSISRELAPHGIRVNAVAPGLIDTSMMGLMEEGAKSEMLDGASMKRAGLALEVARTVAFLSSDEASFITGQILRVDGGL